MMLEEVRVLSKLETIDKETFEERSHFFTKDVVVAVMEDYLDKLKEYIQDAEKETMKNDIAIQKAITLVMDNAKERAKRTTKKADEDKEPAKKTTTKKTTEKKTTAKKTTKKTADEADAE